MALSEASLENSVSLSTDKLVFIGEFSILGILNNGVNPTVSNSDTLEVETKATRSDLLNEVIGNSGDIVAGIALTSDEEIATLVVGVSSQESLDEGEEVSSNLVLIGIIVENAAAF